MKISQNKGFTLIELLVVIAIIGILSSVVLASLTTARARGQDTAVTSMLSSMRAQAELYFSTYGNYGTSYTGTSGTSHCSTVMFSSTTPNGIGKLIDGVVSNKATAPLCYVDNTTTATKWVMQVSLPSDSAKKWCVDSTGRSASTTASTTATACN